MTILIMIGSVVFGYYLGYNSKSDNDISELHTARSNGFDTGFSYGLHQATDNYSEMEKKLLGFNANVENLGKGVYQIVLIHKPEYKELKNEQIKSTTS